MSKRIKRNGVAISSLITLLFILVSTFWPTSSIVLGLTPSLQPPDKPTYVLGETVTIPGSVDFSEEDSTKATVTLIIEGPQPLTHTLPVTPGTYDYPAKNLKVIVTAPEGADWGYGYGYDPNAVRKLNYQIKWTPPIFLDPPPVFKIIPAWDEAFPVPTPLPTATPAPGGPPELGESVLAFNVPGLATPTPVPGAPADLPSVTEAFEVPLILTPTPQPGVVDLPSTTEAFAVPLVPTPTPVAGAPAPLPAITEAFAVPVVPLPTPVPGIPILGETAKAFGIPEGKIPEGIATDGTSFYILVNGDTSDANDRVLKVDAVGVQLGSFPVPSRRAEAITYLGGFLYIANNEFWPPKIMKIDPADGSKKAEWDAPNTNNIRGLANDGTPLWMANEWGNQIFKVTTSGTLLDTMWTNWQNFNAMAYKENLFTAQGNKIGAWDKDTKQSLSSWFTTLVDIRGMTFLGDVLYIADADTQAVYKSQPPSLIEVTKEPVGMAYDGTNLYIAVDGTPRDKVLVVNPADGSLVKSYDAPDDKIGGLAYLGTNLYALSNANRKVFKLNPDTGAAVSDFAGPGWTDLTALATDGTNFFIGQKQGREIYIRSQTGTDQGQVQDWGSPLDGYQALEHRALTDELFSALAGNIGRFQKSDGKYLSKWATTLTDIRGLAFVGDTLYVADAGTQKLYKASIPSGITVTDVPQGMAYDGTNLYIIVDASPKDKILVVNPADGSLVKSFDAPSDRVDGITFLGTNLYVGDNGGSGQRYIRKLDKDNGSVVDEFIGPGGGWSDIQGLTNNGTKLIAGVKNSRALYVLNPATGTEDTQYGGDWNDPRDESDGLAYRSSAQEIFVVDGGKKKMVRLNNEGHYIQAWTLTQTDVRGLTFVGELLYIADAATKKVYKASIPSGLQVTNEPQDLAYDGTDLYIVVDALPKDKVLVVNTADGSLLRSFDAPSDKVEAIAFLGTSLYVADNGGGGQRHIRKLDKNTGAELDEFISPGGGWNDITALISDGTNFFAGRKDDKAISHNRGTDLSELHWWWGDWNDPRTQTQGLAYRSSTQELFAVDASKKKIVRLSNQASYLQAWTLTLTDMRGLAFVGDYLYIADVGTKKVYKASIPSGLEFTKSPQGIAYDGTNFYIVVDALPKDRILVVNPADGTLISSFDAPSDKVDDITYLGTSLYVADNAPVNNQRYIRKLNKDTGAEVDDFISPGGGWDDIASLTNDGANLIAGKRNNKELFVVRPSDGNQLNQYWGDWNNPLTGTMSLAYDASKEKLYAAEGKKVVRLEKDGTFLQSWTTARLDIRGLAMAGGLLFIADADSEAIYKAAIPRPTVTVSTKPLDLATDGTYLYMVVDGSPKDKILVVNPANGSVVKDYNAPGDGAEGLTYIAPHLYVSTAEQTQQGFQSKIHKINKDDGTVLDSFNSPNNREMASLAPAFTTGKLIAGPRADNTYFIIDLANPASFEQRWLSPGSFPVPIWGFEAMAQSSLYAVSQGQLLKIDRQIQEYVVTDARGLAAGSDVRGIAFIGTTLYLADAATNRLMTSTAPGKSPERTTAGSYTAKLQVQLPGKASALSSPQSFDLSKISQVAVAITEPLDKAAFATPDITVRGQVNDPSIKTVFMGMEVPFFVILKDDVENVAISDQWLHDGLWQRTDKGKANSGQFAWYYGQTPAMNYETGQINSGSLTSWEFEVGDATGLDFTTWYNTEAGLKSDRKLIQVYGTLNQGGQDITQWWTLGQIVDFVPVGTPPPPDAASSFTFVQLPMAFFQFLDQPRPAFSPVHLNLDDFRGQNVRIRFLFDTVDQYINVLEGWYVDDIQVAGSGLRGKAVSVGAGGVFTTTATLADGVNTIEVKAVNPYTEPPLTAKASVKVSLDRTAPYVRIKQVQSPTNIPSQEIKVEFNEENWKLFSLEVTNAVGTRVVAAIKELPQGNLLTQVVSLVEGVNVIKATLEDKSGLLSIDQTSILVDMTAPALMPLDTIYPTGKVSARAGTATQKGDPVIIQMNAADSAAGIKEVLLVLPGGTGGQVVMVPALWAAGGTPPAGMESLPEAVRDQWGASGQFILPLRVPQGLPPGGFQFQVIARDRAGNETRGAVSIQIAPVLSAYNIYLMPKWNLVSLPLIPDSALYAADQNSTQIAKLVAGVNGLKRAWYYEAGTKTWHIYEPGKPSDVEAMETGKGYWVYMDESVFKMSPPLGPGLPQTPAPIRLSYIGQFLEPATVPPTYGLVSGWNLVGLHSEWPKVAKNYLAGVTFPQRVWAYLLRYDNLIRFEFEEDTPPQIVLGGFASLDENTVLEPGQGYWLFLTSPGSIAP